MRDLFTTESVQAERTLREAVRRLFVARRAAETSAAQSDGASETVRGMICGEDPRGENPAAVEVSLRRAETAARQADRFAAEVGSAQASMILAATAEDVWCSYCNGSTAWGAEVFYAHDSGRVHVFCRACSLEAEDVSGDDWERLTTAPAAAAAPAGES